MKDLTSNIKTYAIAIISIIVVIFLVPYVILPQIEKISANLKVVNEDSKKLKEIEAKANALDALKLDQDTLEANLKVAESALPIEKDVAKLVRGVGQLAVNSGLTVSQLKIQPGKTATSSATPAASATTAQTQVQVPNAAETVKENLLIELGLSGPKESFQTFLKSIEAAKRILLVNEYKVTANKDNNTYSLFVSAPFGQLPKLSPEQVSAPLAQLSEENKKLLKDLQSSIFNNVTEVELPTGPVGEPNPF